MLATRRDSDTAKTAGRPGPPETKFNVGGDSDSESREKKIMRFQEEMEGGSYESRCMCERCRVTGGGDCEAEVEPEREGGKEIRREGD